MKKILFILLLSLHFVMCGNLISAPKILPNIDSRIKYNNMGIPVAYTIFLPGEKQHDGSISFGEIYEIRRVSKEHYQANVINVKLKQFVDLGKDPYLLSVNSFHSIMQNYGIRSIRAPFASYSMSWYGNNDVYGLNRIYEVSFEADIDPFDVCLELMKNPEIEYCSPIFMRYTSEYVPNDPNINQQYYLQSINAYKAWELSKGSSEISIAIIDTGVDYLHPDLLNNIWTNPNEILNGQDSDGNGKVDDIRGWDFVGNVTENDITSRNWKENNDPMNLLGSHGTMVAGCASAVTNNGVGIAGVGFSCKIIPIKVAADNPGFRGIYRGYEAIAYAANLGADIINCSWGGIAFDPVEQQIINAAIAKGSFIVASAGNESLNVDNVTYYPANAKHVLSVGATGTNNQVAGFSNFGYAVAVWAPGSSVYTTSPNNGYGRTDGTSFSAPIVAGLAGLIKAKNSNYTPQEIYHQLRGSVDAIEGVPDALRPNYFGMVNAFKALDYNSNEAKAMPGIEISNLTFTSGSSSALSDYSSREIKVSFKNYLANANDVVIEVSPIDYFITVSQTVFNIEEISKNGSKDILFNVQLQQNNPWYNGYARLSVKIISDWYINYELINVPIQVPSDNFYTMQSTLPQSDVPRWHRAHSPRSNVLWLAGERGFFGTGGGYLRNSGLSTSYKTISSDPICAVFALDEKIAYLGSGPSNGQAKIYRTTNSGTEWLTVGVETITRFVNDIHFFDVNEGVLLGDPRSDMWGVGFTVNGGLSWQRVVDCPSAIIGETGFVGSTFWFEDNGWFGTSNGRVFRSTNRGRAWQASTISGASIVYLVGFSDAQNGIAVYSTSAAENAPRLVASTTDGGATWTTNVVNLNNINIFPAYLFTTEESEAVFMLCYMGEVYYTQDKGKTFKTVLSRRRGTVQTGAAVQASANRARLFDVGNHFGYLDFNYQPYNVFKNLEIQSGQTVNYETVFIGSNKLENVTLFNNGNVPITIDDYELSYGANTSETEFVLFGIPAKTIQDQKSVTIRVRFVPETEGEKSAVLRIISDADNSPSEVYLVGIGEKELSVNQNELGEYLSIDPNPASNYLNLNWNVESELFTNLSITDALGNKLMTIFDGISASGKNAVSIDISHLSQGIYFINYIFNRQIGTQKFVIVR